VTVVDLEIVDATLFETTLDVTLRISNDNPEALVLDGAVVRLELGGVKVGKGATGERVEVPRLDSVTRHVEVHLNHLALATRIKGIIDQKVVDYGVSGKVYVLQRSGAIRKMDVSGEGRLDLRAGAAKPPTTEATGGDPVD
jgi:LEA14-like dessication related protein